MVKIFTTGESVQLRAQTAELKIANLKLAMGIAESAESSTSYPSYEGGPSGGGYSADADASFDVLSFGGKKTLDEMPLRFVHTRPNGKDVVVVFYNAIALPEITIPFAEEEVTLHDLVFKALHVTSRTAGDQLGFIADQVQGS